MTAIEEFQQRIVRMISEGWRGFHFTPGAGWNDLTTEERCADILRMWDAPSKKLDFKDSYHRDTVIHTNFSKLDLTQSDYDTLQEEIIEIMS